MPDNEGLPYPVAELPRRGKLLIIFDLGSARERQRPRSMSAAQMVSVISDRKNGKNKVAQRTVTRENLTPC